jgi:hypothetical protein
MNQRVGFCYKFWSLSHYIFIISIIIIIIIIIIIFYICYNINSCLDLCCKLFGSS